ncbi:MAG: acyl-CoA thioesterase [Chitinophagales bacterium]
MFHHIITVRGFHCDLFGHVNNARYLEFLEEARWEWLNRNSTFEFFEKHKLSFVVVSITIHYRRPSVLNDVLHISVSTKTIGNRSATVHQDIVRKQDGKLVAEADVTFAMVDNSTGKSIQLSEELKKFLED